MTIPNNTTDVERSASVSLGALIIGPRVSATPRKSTVVPSGDEAVEVACPAFTILLPCLLCFSPRDFEEKCAHAGDVQRHCFPAFNCISTGTVDDWNVATIASRSCNCVKRFIGASCNTAHKWVPEMSGFYVRLGRGVEWTDSPALVPPSDTSFSYAKAPDKLQFSFSLVVPQEALDNWNLASDRLGVNTFGDWSHILDHQFGIKPVWAEISREREGKPTQTTKLDATLFTCDSIPNVGALSILRPTALQNCRLRLAYDLTSETLQLADGDTLEVTLHGELEAWYIHKTHGPQTSRHVIPATEYSRLGVALYRIDETAPQLCTQAPFVRGFGLDLEMLSNKYFVTEESPLAFRVVGWWDALSRVAKFSWTLHRMDYNVGTKLVHEVSPSIHSGTVAVTQFSSAQGCKGEETVLMMDPITVSNAGNVGGPGL